MCEAGGVLVNDHEAKPAKEIRPGDHITLLFTSKTIGLEVLALPAQKTVQKANVADLYRIISENRRVHEDQSWTKNRASL
jgi:ribosomal 50S subunit-recycling heat shock protein